MHQTLGVAGELLSPPMIQPAKDRDSLFTMTHHRLMPIHPKGSSQTKIANRFQNAGLAAAVLSV